MRRVYLESRGFGWALHSLYNTLIEHPPSGYKFVTDFIQSDRGSMLRSLDKSLARHSTLRTFYDLVKPISYLGYYGLTTMKQRSEVDFTYSSQHIVFRDEPWVVDLEFATALSAYGKITLVKSLIEKKLGSKFCKWILPWTDMAHKTLLFNLDCEKFQHKIRTVHLAVTSKNGSKIKKDDKLRLLFMGTKNVFNIPYSFELKGGPIILSAFSKLMNDLPNIELIIRSDVPNWVRKRYGSCENIHIIDKIIPPHELDRIFRLADIFVYPGHQTPGLAILDAMSYGLPVIATDVWANKEMVTDGENGLLTSCSKKFKYVNKNLIPLWGESSFLKRIVEPDDEMVEDLVDKITVLILNDRLRRKMGEIGKMEIDRGRFSIGNRNEKLKKLFDEI